MAAASFTPDLSQWFQLGASKTEFGAGESGAYHNSLDGPFEPLSPRLVPGETPANPRTVVEGSALRGASADHSRLYFVSGLKTVSYVPGDPVLGGPGADHNTYVAFKGSNGVPSLELIPRDRLGQIWGGSCGSRLGGIGPDTFGVTPKNGPRNRGAISADGSRTYFSARVGQSTSTSCDTAANKLRILERLESEQGPWIGELFDSECTRVSPACSSADGDDLYQAASVDGSKVYFTTNRQLANSDLDGTSAECSNTSAISGCDLYLYDSERPGGNRLIQVSKGEDVGGHEAGKEAKVFNGTAGVSGDGSRAYFTAQGVLTGPNPEGKSPMSGSPNLYLYEAEEAPGEGSLTFIGTLASNDQGTLWGTGFGGAYPVPLTGKDAAGKEIGGDGRLLFLVSRAPLTADDEDGGFADVFRYDTEDGTIERISKGVPEGVDNGPHNAAASSQGMGTEFAEEGRWASEDGKTVVFKTTENLSPGGTDGAFGSYLWRDGELSRLPGTTDESGRLADSPVLSHDGSSVAFQTYAQLLPSDIDQTKDVYVARIGGGYEPEAEANSCEPLEEGSCQGEGGMPPAPHRRASSTFTGPGNIDQANATSCTPNARRAQRLSRRAKRLRTNAGRVNKRGNRRRAVRLHRKSNRLAKQARGLSRKAKRCRRLNREGGR
jgi:hypothetical protein